MAVKVAQSSIERSLREEGRYGIMLRLKPGRRQWPATGDAATMAAFEDAVAHANAVGQAQSPTGEPAAWASIIAPSPQGPVVYLDRPGHTEAETRTWLTALAAHLETAGISGSVALAPQDWGPDWLYERRTVPLLTAFHAYSLATPFPAGTPGPWPSTWGVDSAITDDLLDGVATWCAAVPDPQVYLTQGMSEVRFGSGGTEAEGQLPSILAATLGQPEPGTAGITFVHEDPMAVRRARLAHWGQVTLQIDSPAGWPERLDALVEPLRRRPADLDLGLVKLNLQTVSSFTEINRLPRLPYVDETSVWLNRHLWHRYTPDAHGLQILTDEHLSRANDLSGWLVEQVAPGRHLVRARDLEPWFSGAEPATDLLASARHDFGAMILTREVIAAENR